MEKIILTELLSMDEQEFCMGTPRDIVNYLYSNLFDREGECKEHTRVSYRLLIGKAIKAIQKGRTLPNCSEEEMKSLELMESLTMCYEYNKPRIV